ncbi:MAG: LamG-like jellyroll fold domain-containing protein, partial [Ekhidna sp.]|uniref:LamG-like jellyroll fold domain-containing protein n=1 Tax=Ekhidna sp. TaxID=2608089 RepID=UPI0032EAA600
MKSYLKSIFIFFLSFTSILASAQEICDNGIDDDGDGLIDCYDGQCSDTGACEDFFFGNSVNCADEIDVTTFAIRRQWGSEDGSANSHATPMVGDLDGNGIPEVVVTNKQARSVFILNGATGATIASTTFGFDPENAPVLGNIDGDEFGEILVSQDQGDDMIMFNHDLTILWSGKSSRNDAIGLPGFADFDEDGDVEIYYRNEIVDAATGTIIVTGTNSDWERNFTHGSLAVDLLPASACADCAGLELISGNEVWAINESAGTRTLVRDMDDDIHDDIASNLNYYPKYYSSWDDQWSTVSAADYNLDGNLDLIITGALGTSSEQYNGETTIFFWDVTNGNVITYHDPSNNFVRGPGRVNIGDVDGDGQLNANFVMNQKLYSLDENFNVHWIHPIKEGSSGFTGCSLFDFDGDGAVEVVYRSEESLLIVDGVGNGDNTTTERREIACVSRTQEEYPVIADVDGDGASEICVTCYFNNSTPFNPYENSEFSHVRVFESDGEAWMPARGVWNQHGYYNVNINDDLTIPQEVQDHSLVFSDGLCAYADGSLVPFPSRPLNTFLNQAPILNEDGCVEFASPDIDFIGIVSATDAQCPDAEITVEFEITNTGDIGISGNLPVSYYAGDPRIAGATLLDTEVTFLTNFEVGETVTITQTISGIGGNFELFVVINDAGGTPPISVPLPTASIPECETGNNIQNTLVGFQSFDLTVEKINDNRKCVPTVPDNASARAYYFGPAPGATENFWVENFQDRTDGAQSDTDGTSWTSDGGTQSPSFFGVATYSGSKMFRASGTGTSNDVGVVTWTSQDIDISNYTDLSVTVDIFENGDQEGSGEWRDWVRVSYELKDGGGVVTESGELGNGFQIGDFTFAQALIGNLNADGSNASLVIIAEIHNTSSTEHHYIDNIVVDGTGPDITAEYTEADGFVFNWYNDDDYSSPVYTGSQYPQMADGIYDVIGYYETTECYSDTVEIEIQLVAPLVHAWAYEVTSETNCDLPNGSVAGFVYTQTTDGTFPADPDAGNFPLDSLYTDDGYEFEWFLTSDLSSTIIATGDTLTDVSASNYTVRVVQTLTGCTVDAVGEVTSTLVKPDADNIDVVITNIQTCGGTGTLSASIGGNTADYTFYWYDGVGVRPTPDFTGPVYTVSDIGNYTVTAEENSSGCVSENFQVVVMGDDSNAPVMTAAEIQPNSTCGLNPTGIAEATVNGNVGDPGFEYTWYLGVNTIPENEIPSGSFPSASFGAGEWEMTGLREGTYTIVVEETATSCMDTTTVYISDNFVEPEFALNNEIDTEDAINLVGQGYVELPQLFGPGLDVETALTISYWADFTSANYANDHRTFSSGATGENQTLLWSDNHDGLAFVVKTTGGGRGRINSAYSATGWTNVTGTWDGTTGEMKLYANGVVIGESNFVGSGILRNAGPNMFLGRDANQNYGKFQGVIDELRIFNTVLDASTINQYMCQELTGAEPGLVAYYNFNNIPGAPAVGDGANVPDESGNGNNGTATYNGGSVNTLTADIECPVADAIANTSCDASSPNGSIDLSSFITPPGANYTYRLYEGFSTDVELDNNSSGLFTGLAGGFYTLTAEDDVTDCITPPVTVSLADIPDHPNIFVDITDDPNCGTPGGGEILVTSSSNVVEPVSYTYELYQGHSFATPIGGSPTVNDGSTGFTFTGLEDGNYRISVTNNDLTCDDFVDVVVGEVSTVPVFSATRTVNDNTSCDALAPNGFISVSIVEVGFDPNDYIFTWYRGDDSGDPVEAGPTAGLNSLSGLDASDYTVVAQSVATGCETVELTLTVNDDPYVPSPSIEEVSPQTDCGTGNGSLRAFINGPDAIVPCIECVESDGFSFQWQLDGVDLVNGGTAANGSVPSGVNTSTVSGLIADEYTVIITHDDTQCSVTESFVLSENQQFPIATLVGTNPNTGCIPAAYDGEIEVSASPAGTYDFQLLDENGDVIPGVGVISGASATFQNLGEGTYKAVATGANLCTSDTLNVNLTLVPATPSPNAVEDEPSTSCNIGNGRAITDGDGAGNVLGFTYEWFLGNNTLPANALPGAANPNAFLVNSEPYHLGGLEPEIYTVRVTDDANGCSTITTVEVTDAKEDPLLVDESDIVITNQTTCDPSNYGGSIDITQVLQNPQTVSINNINGSFENPDILTASNHEQSFDGGRIKTFDQSDISGWSTTAPDQRIEIWNATNTVRPHAAYEGNQWAEINANSDAALYFDLNTQPGVEMIWRFAHRGRSGVDEIGLYIGPSGGALVEITTETSNNDQWYVYEGTYTVPDGQYFTRFEYRAIATSGGNNSVGNFIDGVEFFMDPYTYEGELADGSGTLILDPENDGIFDNLPAGEYQFTVTDNYTGCSSEIIYVTVEDDSEVPLFQPAALNAGTFNNTVCDETLAIGTYNGAVTMERQDANPDVSNFQFTWYDGAGTSTPTSFAVNNNELSELPGGIYTVEIQDLTTLCDTTIQVTIDDLPDADVVNFDLSADADKTDDTLCNADNGTITFDETNLNAVGGSGNYELRVHIGTS